MKGHFWTHVKVSKISYLKLNMLYLTVYASDSDRINFTSQCLRFRKKNPMVTVARTRDSAILQSKQQTWRTYGAGEGRVCRVSRQMSFFFNKTQRSKSLNRWY